jgi:hypothetical protein
MFREGEDDSSLRDEVLELFLEREEDGRDLYAEEKLKEQRAKRPLEFKFPQAGESNAAMRSPGGIDFDANKMGMRVSKEGAGVDITFDPAMVERMKRDGFDGFVPVIINITPVASILPLLGLAPRREEEEQLVGV